MPGAACQRAGLFELGQSRHVQTAPTTTFVRLTPLATLALPCRERSDVPIADIAANQFLIGTSITPA